MMKLGDRVLVIEPPRLVQHVELPQLAGICAHIPRVDVPFWLMESAGGMTVSLATVYCQKVSDRPDITSSFEVRPFPLASRALVVLSVPLRRWLETSPRLLPGWPLDQRAWTHPGCLNLEPATFIPRPPADCAGSVPPRLPRPPGAVCASAAEASKAVRTSETKIIRGFISMVRLSLNVSRLNLRDRLEFGQQPLVFGVGPRMIHRSATSPATFAAGLAVRAERSAT